MALRLCGFRLPAHKTYLHAITPLGCTPIRTVSKLGKESKTEETKGDKQNKPHPIKFPVNVGESFRAMPASIALGVDITGKTTVGFTMLDHRGSLLASGSIETKGIRSSYKRAKHVRNRLEDELTVAKDKLKKLLLDNYETEFNYTGVSKKRTQDKVEVVNGKMRGLRYVSAVPVVPTKSEDLFSNFLAYECFNLLAEEEPHSVDQDASLTLLDINPSGDAKKNEINKLVFDKVSPLIPYQDWVRGKSNELDPSNFSITNAYLLAHCALRNQLVELLARTPAYWHTYRKQVEGSGNLSKDDKEEKEVRAPKEEKERDKESDKKDKDKEGREKEGKEKEGKEKEGKEKEGKEKDGKEKDGKERDNKEAKDRDTKEVKESKEIRETSEVKESKEKKDKDKDRDAHDTKEKEMKDKDTKDSKGNKDTTTKEKDTKDKDTKEKDVAETKEDKKELKKFSHDEITTMFEEAIRALVDPYYRRFLVKLREDVDPTNK